MFAMLREGLVDTISPDYAGGHHDPIPLAIAEAVEDGATTVAAGIAMASSHVAEPLRASRPIVDASAPAQWRTSCSQTRGGWMTFDGYSWPATPSSRPASSPTDDERPSVLTETSRDPSAERRLLTSSVRVPDDLALISFDDFPWAPLLDSALTVVDQRPQEMGTRATELILAEPAHDEPVEIIVSPSLIIRRSCGAQNGQSTHLLAASHQDA